jgi:hypothetical protein
LAYLLTDVSQEGSIRSLHPERRDSSARPHPAHEAGGNEGHDVANVKTMLEPRSGGEVDDGYRNHHIGDYGLIPNSY